MLKVDLYLNQMDLRRYWPESATIPWEDFLIQIKAGQARLEDYTFLTHRQIQAFKLMLEAEQYLPSIPPATAPQPMEGCLFLINEPDENSLVIVSGNSRLTFEILATVWAQGTTPVYLLLVDCLGNTVDMAVVYGDFTAKRLQQAVERSGLEDKIAHRHMIVPGVTAYLADDFIIATDWEVEVGPICAAELPSFLGERWIF